MKKNPIIYPIQYNHTNKQLEIASFFPFGTYITAKIIPKLKEVFMLEFIMTRSGEIFEEEMSTFTILSQNTSLAN